MQMWQGRGLFPAQMWQGRAQSWRRCGSGRGEPSPGADVTVAEASPVPVQMWQWQGRAWSRCRCVMGPQVNASPSLSANTPADYDLKFRLLDDMLNIIDMEHANV